MVYFLVAAAAGPVIVGIGEKVTHIYTPWELEIFSGSLPYIRLFAAFRNNTLDYRQFYETVDDKMLSGILKKQVHEENGQYYNDAIYNIARRIEESERPKKLNVILVSFESLSAKFLKRFGEKIFRLLINTGQGIPETELELIFEQF